jgi:glycosyltransferase involved in cell wall biosynthesis
VSSAAQAPGAVAVVVPAFEAAPTVGDVVARVRRAAPGATVLVVDDGSADDTAARALAAGAAVASHGTNLGKGRALATGLAAAAALAGARYVVTLDADGQHPPEALPALLVPLEAGAADLVVGARRREPGVMPLGRRCTNWLSSTLVSRAVGFSVPDSQSGFRAMTVGVAARVRAPGRGYEYETEFLLAAAAAGFRLAAVPVPTLYAGAPSHFRHVRDTLRLARVFLRHWRAILAGPTFA